MSKQTVPPRLPFAEVYEARYDVKGSRERGEVDVALPAKSLHIVAFDFEAAVVVANGSIAHVKGTKDLELRDVRLIDASVVVAIPPEEFVDDRGVVDENS